MVSALSRGRPVKRCLALSILGAFVGLALIFRIAGFHSITEFVIENRLSHNACSIQWDQRFPTCSDVVADFVDLPLMRVFATTISVSDWHDLSLHEIVLVPEHCTTLAVRHTLRAYGIITEPGLITQTVWLSDGGVYTVAGRGFVRGKTATLCIGPSGNDNRRRFGLQLTSGKDARYTVVFKMPLIIHG